MSSSTIQPNALPPPEVIFGRSPMMRSIQEQIHLIADTPISVLLLGESGTGKEVFARLLHRSSSQAKGGFVKLSCPAIPATLLETELFGYQKGAFTGAYGNKRGRVELAHNGTLFLDEIGDLDLALQSKLLQLLQDGTYSRVGGQDERQVTVRLVSATNRNLRELVAAGSFRQDLFHRINALTIELPALRHRIADLPILVDHFISMYSALFGRSALRLTQEMLQRLQHYHWPGNIRELENVIRRYVIFGTEESITTELRDSSLDTLHPEIQIDTSVPLKEITKRAVVSLEREIIMKVLQQNDWNRKRTAKSLQISYRSLIYKMRDAGFPLIRTRMEDTGVASGLSTVEDELALHLAE